MALAPPVPGGKVTQRFGVSALSQEYHYWHVGSETAMFGQYAGSSYAAHFHAAVDYSAPLGTNVLAPEASTITWAGWAQSPGPYAGGGIVVEGKIAGGMRWAACHLEKALVTVGQRVNRGQRVGLLGSTGNSTGPHVHFPICTLNTSGARLFRNPDHYLPGGKYATSSLISTGTALPDTAEGHPVWLDNVKAASGTIHFTAGAKLYSDPGKVVGSVAGTSSAKRVLTLVHSDGSKWSGYVLADPNHGLRLVSNGDPHIDITA